LQELFNNMLKGRGCQSVYLEENTLFLELSKLFVQKNNLAMN